MSKTSSQTVTELLSLTPHVQQFPTGRLIYVVAQKESNTGMFNNSRVLVFNGKERIVGYSDVIPKFIPLQNIDGIKEIKKTAPISLVEITKKKDKLKVLEIKCKETSYKNKVSNKEETWAFSFKTPKAANETYRLLNESICQSLGRPLPEGMGPPMRQSTDTESRSPFQALIVSQPVPKVQEPRPIQRQSSSLQKYKNNSLPQIKQQDHHHELPKYTASYLKQSQVNSFGRQSEAKRRSNIHISEDEQPPMDGFRYTHKQKPQNWAIQQNYSSIKPSFEQPLIQPSSLARSKQIQNSKSMNIHYINDSPSQNNQSSPILPSYKPSNLKHSISHVSLAQPPMSEEDRLLIESRPISISPYDVEQPIPKYNSHKYVSGIITQEQRINNINYIQRNSYTKQVQNSNLGQSKKSEIKEKYPDWNKELYYAKDPYEVINKFGETSSLLTKSIIDSFTNDNNYFPTSVGDTTTVFEQKNMFIIMAFTNHNEESTEAETNLTKQYETYKYLSSFMTQKDKMRIPLVNLIKYKGIVTFAKALVGNFTDSNKQTLKTELARLQGLTRISRQSFINNCNFKKVHFGENSIVFVDDIYSLLPSEKDISFHPVLLGNYHGDYKVPNVAELERFRNKQEKQLVRELEALETIVLNSDDLNYQMRRYGLTSTCIPQLYRNTRFQFLKSVFASEMVAEIATNLLFSYIKTQLKLMTKKNIKNSDKTLLKLCSQFIDDLCSITDNSQQLWKLILKDVDDTYFVKVTLEQIKWGYFFGAFLNKSGLKYNMRLLDKEKRFCQEINCLSPHFVEGFVCKYQLMEVESYHEIVAIKDILNKEATEGQFKKLKGLLETVSVAQYLENISLFQRSIVYLAKYVSPTASTSLLVNPYQYPSEPTSLTYIRLQLIKLNWLLKHKDEQYSISILQQSCELISFWGGEFHPLLSQFYDLFCSYYLMTDQKDESLTLAKSSLVNTIKLVGTGSIATGEKYYQLGNILYTLERRQQSLTHYIKARDVLANNGLINSPQFGLIELKIGSLYLHFGKLAEAQASALHALNAYEEQREQKLMECFELLARVYELQPNYQKMREYASLCSIKFNSSEDEQLFARMIRVSIYPFIIELPRAKKLKLLQISETMDISIQSQIEKKVFYKWLFKKALKQNIIEIFINALAKIDLIASNIDAEVLKTYKGIRNPAESKLHQFLNLLECVLVVSEPAYIIGILRDFQY